MPEVSAYPSPMDLILAHGTGNTFVVLPDLDDQIKLTDGFVRALTNPSTGFGTDGVIRIGPGHDGAAGFMDYRNADGSVVEMCGNGVRVTAKYLVDSGVGVLQTDGVIAIATRAGVKEVTVTGYNADGSVREVAVAMGEAVFDPTSLPYLPVDPAASIDQLPLTSAEPFGQALPIRTVSFGNPHAVTTVDDVTLAPVTTLGPIVETHERFPNRVNVGFAQVIGRDTLRLRVWERGVGETAACGSGACAAVAVHQRDGLLDAIVQVEVPGGILSVERAPDGGYILTGNAVFLVSGTLDATWLSHAVLDYRS
ncbi:MAG: diaminopimelate epimerase [Nitriliruptoraceae bacterium]